MKVFVLANGGTKIGMGHIMRTLVLGKELKNEIPVIYVITNKEEFKPAIKKVIDEKFNYIYEEDILNEISKEDILIIDRYDLTENDLVFYKSKVKLLMVFDDNNLLPYYDVDIILNQNLHGVNLNYKANSNTKILVGGEYSLLRDEFLDNKPIEIKKDINNIILTVGGSDNLNFTHRILKEIKHFSSTINVVIGPAFNDKEILMGDFKDYQNIIFHENANMTELMKKSDLAISACGSTIYELSFLGVPSIGIVIVDNQEKLGQYISENNIAIISKIEDINKNIKSMNYELRKNLSENMKKSIDGQGKYRVANEILKSIKE
ncbi:UDP-2,4-diacetamido-2,4,6-trideoxy-beta-L-altropyranose hydrolase [uncultured Clostridium sp.]|jgi:UDP-2,4-diacetamido-2,4,6-trideoxy-beta-L-altropyranose hydrolase|uniref:UDP-2,4-diacetamido-2,4, 6-trideoxy-beta-L-altropyranose hydrolase n=1 Tax=uncultured Clostridium sp. TaxID=59620 RepID=UPI002631DAE7|nr:UDP-2,4-diacetamido-2,4,6-trideoxy-beta-L-altropyranose hydrolase [uncultured Clostridium sp.]